ncbi:MAG: molybdopterin-dependent oxidoreductase [Planctomycetota bacterium]
MQSLRLEAAGRATELARDELAALPDEHQVPDVGAVAAGRQGRAARLCGVLGLVEVPPDARFVHVESADGSFTANIPLEDARAGGLVLYELDGEPLPERFGGPFRLLFPDGDDCSVSVKFLGRIDVLAEPGSHTARCADD